jgi:hypothetical protein
MYYAWRDKKFIGLNNLVGKAPGKRAERER